MTVAALTIRPASAADFPAIAAIWAPILRDTTIIFASDERPPDVVARIVAERLAGGYPFFVAVAGGVVLGFASYSQFRSGNGYATSMEHTVILAPDARGQGVGRALMQAVEDHARAAGAHTMVGVVAAENPEGIAFHTALGYRDCGRLPEVGAKFGRFLDAVFLVKIL
jgi:phosphinothricin acetyltransferase